MEDVTKKRQKNVCPKKCILTMGKRGKTCVPKNVYWRARCERTFADTRSISSRTALLLTVVMMMVIMIMVMISIMTMIWIRMVGHRNV